MIHWIAPEKTQHEQDEHAVPLEPRSSVRGGRGGSRYGQEVPAVERRQRDQVEDPEPRLNV